MAEMMVRENRVLKAISEGRKAIGYQMTFPSVWDVEILGRLDFDYVWLDGEHGPFGYTELEEMVRAVEAAGATAVARVENVEASHILQYVDRGYPRNHGPAHREWRRRRETRRCVLLRPDRPSIIRRQPRYELLLHARCMGRQTGLLQAGQRQHARWCAIGRPRIDR